MTLTPLESFYTVEVDTVTEKDWIYILSLFSDSNLYQTWSYGSVRWGSDNLSHLILKYGDDIVAAAQIRILTIVPGWMQIAYIRYGPLWHRINASENAEVLQKILKALRDEYVNNRKISLWIMPNEVTTENDKIKNIYQKEKFKWKKNRDRTIILNMNPELKDLRTNLHKNWRRNLIKAEKNQLEVVEGIDLGLFDLFFDCYNNMRERKTFYAGSVAEEYKEIQKSLPDSMKMRVFVCRLEKNLIASVIVSAIGNKSIYHLGATTGFGLNYKGSFLLHWKVIEWLKNKNILYYDLCGINPKDNPGGYRFKTGLSGEDTYYIGEFESYPNLFAAIFIKIADYLRKFMIFVRIFVLRYVT